MSKQFSAKKYFSKVYAYDLLKDLYKKHNVEIFIEVNDQTPRKVAIDMMLESFNAIDTEQKIDIEKELTNIASYSTDNTALLAKSIFKENFNKEFEPEVECQSAYDVVLYFFLNYEDLIPDLIFLHEFYLSKNYFKYETRGAKSDEDVSSQKANDAGDWKEDLNKNLTELKNDWDRIANDNSKATECEFTSKELGDILYIRSVFEGSYEKQIKINSKTGEVDRANTVRKIETVRLAYLPKENLALISGSVSKSKKLYFLDSFLRTVCQSGYDGKIETFDVSPLKNLSFEFLSVNKGTPLMKWKIKNITLSYKEGKKKLRLTLNSDKNASGLDPLSETLEELGMKERFETLNIENISLSFSFNNEERENSLVNVNCSISKGKVNLCPLFKYDNYALKLLKLAEINKGFEEKIEK